MEVDPIKKTEAAENTAINPVLADTPALDVPEEFSSFIKAAIGGEAKTEANEEELFSALVEKKLAESNEEAANHFREEKAKLMVSEARADGYVNVEEVTLQALQSTVDEGLVDEATAETINGEAFRAAQLDDNLSALYDGRGSGNDPTIAVMSVADAMGKMHQVLEQIKSGELTAEGRPLSGATGGSAGGSVSGGMQELDGPQGFLWKPESESDGNLVVLLPTNLRGMIDKVGIYSSADAAEGTLLEEGRFSGDEHNGARPHFRFNNPGGEYGDPAYVVAHLDNGEQQVWTISNPSERHD